MFGRVDTANPNVCIACAHLLEDGAPIAEEMESSADPDIPVIVPTTPSADDRRLRYGVISVPQDN